MSAAKFLARLALREPLQVTTLPGFRIRESAPLIAGEIETLASSAWYWPEARAALDTAQMMVEVGPAAEVGEPIERALALTKALSSLVRSQSSVVAVIWEETGLAHDPESWASQAEDATYDDLPLYLWLRFEGQERDDGTRDLRTRGAEAFDQLNIEVIGSRRDGEELLETVCDVALFVLTSPAPLDDGDQVEVTRGKVRVRIEPSNSGDGRRVYKLRLP